MKIYFRYLLIIFLFNTFLSDAQVKIKVSTDQLSSWSIDKNIFGKFFELNGRDGYPGFVSSHLANGSFEQWNEINNDHLRTEILFKDVERLGFVAYPWEVESREQLESQGKKWFEMVEDGKHGRFFQKIINFEDGKSVSLFQKTALPDERTKDYVVSFLARADSPDTKIKISLKDHEMEVLTSEEVEIDNDWKKYEVQLKLSSITDERYRKSPFGVYNLSFMISERAIIDLDHVRLTSGDAVDGKYNPTTFQWMKEFNVPTIRLPGGNYLSMYKWTDGIGQVDERPVSNNNEWGGLEPNYFGTNEFIEFCRMADVEPYLNVPFNLDIAPPAEVAKWVQYVNGDTTTEMGKLRKSHGYPEPWNVKYWQVGNEHYGIYQSGYVFPEVYAKNMVDYVKAMKAEDPTIKVFAAGADPAYEDQKGDEFNEILLEVAGTYIDGIDIHRYVNGRTISRSEFNSIDPVEKAHLFVAFPAQYEKIIEELINDAKARNKDDLAITIGEWNMSLNVPGHGNIDYETMPHAAFVAGMYNAFMRNGEHVKFGHQRDNTLYFRPFPVDFRPVNPGNNVMKMYTQPFVENDAMHLANTTVNSPSFSHPKYGDRFLEMKDIPFVDAVAAVNGDGNKAYIYITNRNINETYSITLNVKGVPKSGNAKISEIYSDNVFAEQNSWYEKVIQEKEYTMETRNGKVKLDIKPASVIRLEFDLTNPLN